MTEDSPSDGDSPTSEDSPSDGDSPTSEDSPSDGDPSPLDDYTRVAAVDDVPSGEGIGVDVGGIEIAVFNADGDFYAISNRCSHQRAPLCKAGDEKINADHCWTPTRGGLDVENLTVSCPWHLWEWDLESGEHEVTGQRIGTFDVRIEGDDVLVRI